MCFLFLCNMIYIYTSVTCVLSMVCKWRADSTLIPQLAYLPLTFDRANSIARQCYYVTICVHICVYIYIHTHTYIYNITYIYNYIYNITYKDLGGTTCLKLLVQMLYHVVWSVMLYETWYMYYIYNQHNIRPHSIHPSIPRPHPPPSAPLPALFGWHYF